jgi:hypothetical protein
MLVFQRVTTVVHDLVYFVRKCTQAGRFNPYAIVMVFPCIIPELGTMLTCTGRHHGFFRAWNWFRSVAYVIGSLEEPSGISQVGTE